MRDDQRIALGLVGDIAARGWLGRRHANVEWVSRYRNIGLADDADSYSSGYDFVARPGKGRRLSFEVERKKAMHRRSRSSSSPSSRR
jgi:hypothetical protein